jgi:hypothetical protein
MMRKQTGLMRDRASLLDHVKSLKSRAAEFDGILGSLEGLKKYRCIQMRNRRIKMRLCADFVRRQRKLARLAEHDNDKFHGSIEVFPVSAEAFCHLLREKKAMFGFPSELSSTGIPKLRQWLDEAVLVHREEHLDLMLRASRRLYHGIKCWSDDDSRGIVHFSHTEAERLLQSSHRKYLAVSTSGCASTTTARGC